MHGRFLWIASGSAIVYAFAACVLYLTLSPQPRATLWLENVSVSSFAPTGELVTLEVNLAEAAAGGSWGSLHRGPIRLWDPHTGQNVATYCHPEGEEITTFTFAGDGQWLAIWSEADGKLRLLNRRTGGMSTLVSGRSRGLGEDVLHVTPDSATLVHTYGVVQSPPAVQVIDLSTQTIQSNVKVQTDDVPGGTLSPNGDLLAIPRGHSHAEAFGEIGLWSVTTGSLVATLQGCPVMQPKLTFSPDGIHLVAAGVPIQDGASELPACCHLYAWDLRNKQLIRSFSNQELIGFMDGGASVLTCAWIGKERGPTLVAFEFPSFRELWSCKPASGEHEYTLGRPVLGGDENGFLAVRVEYGAYSQDDEPCGHDSLGTLLGLTGTNVRIFDKRTGRRVGTIKREIDHLYFAPDGQTVALVKNTTDGTTVDFYDLPPPKPWFWIGTLSFLPAIVALGLGFCVGEREVKRNSEL